MIFKIVLERDLRRRLIREKILQSPDTCRTRAKILAVSQSFRIRRAETRIEIPDSSAECTRIENPNRDNEDIFVYPLCQNIPENIRAHYDYVDLLL